MRRAIEVARTSSDHDSGTPFVGAVIFDSDGVEIGAATHRYVRTVDPTAHAEILAIREAAHTLGRGWRLDGCTLVTTLEPDTMCAGAVVLARISRLVIGSWSAADGAVCSQWDVVRDARLNHVVEVIPQVLQAECDALLATPYGAGPKVGPELLPAPPARAGVARGWLHQRHAPAAHRASSP